MHHSTSMSRHLNAYGEQLSVAQNCDSLYPGANLEFSSKIQSIPCLLMPWQCGEEPWYYLCKMDGPCPSPPWGSISTTCTILVSRNEKKHVFMFPQTNSLYKILSLIPFEFYCRVIDIAGHTSKWPPQRLFSYSLWLCTRNRPIMKPW